MASYLMELFGCASEPNGSFTDVDGKPKSAISPEDEASELRGLDALLAKLATKGTSEAAIAAFKKSYEGMTGGESGIIAEEEIEPVEELPDLMSVK